MIAASLVGAPRLQACKATNLILASAKLVGEKLLELTRQGNPEKLRRFHQSYRLSTCVSFYCQLIAEHWDLISAEDWSGCSLQDVCESL